MIVSLSSSLGRWARPLALAAVCVALSWGAELRSAPSQLVITVPVGTPDSGGLAAQLANWRQTGLVSDGSLLEASAGKAPAFGAVAVLEFPDEALIERWQKVAAPSLAAGLIVTRADLIVRGEKTPRNSLKATFVVASYDILVSPDRYREYAAGYVAPEMDALKTARVLTSYQLLVARPGSAAPWKSLLVMEYPDSLALARGDAAKKAARDQLGAQNAAWKALSDGKAKIRTETALTTCTMAELPAPDLSDLPPYVPEFKVVGGLRILGSDLKGCLPLLAEGFKKFHPDAMVATNYMTSSEGSISGLYQGVSDIAPAGDDAKITDQMPFFNTFNYVPTEISVATGAYEKRGALWALAIVVNKDNPLAKLSMRQLECIFGSERTGGWEIGANADNDLLYTAKYARGAETNLRTWDQVGLSGEYTGKEIQTYGYVAPGFAICFERKLFHWSKKYNPNFKEYVESKEATNDADGRAVSSERMLEAISKDKYGIGWAALLHVRDYPGVKVIAISEGADTPAITHSPENVSNRTYPLIRDAFFYVNKPPGRPLDPKVREFMRFVLSREGQEIIVKAGYFFPLPAGYLQAQRKKLD